MVLNTHLVHDSDPARYWVNPIINTSDQKALEATVSQAIDIALTTIPEENRDMIRASFEWAMKIPAWREGFLKQFFTPPALERERISREDAATNIISFTNIFTGICKDIIKVNPNLSVQEQEDFWRKLQADAMHADLWGMELADYKKKYNLS